MPTRPDPSDLARARLAYITAGQPPLSGPRRAAPEPETPLALQLEALLGTHEDDDVVVDNEMTRPSALPAEGDQPAQAPVAAGPGARATARLAGALRFGRRHAMAVFVLLLCGVGIAMMVLGQSAATSVPVQAVAPPPPSAAPVAPPPASEVVEVRVHVLGAVRQPGVVKLPGGAIVQDAIAAAGGLADGADPGELNLAAPVAEGQQVIVGTVEEPRGELKQPTDGGQTGGGTDATTQLNLNNATAAQLEGLPGVGPVTAASIIAWRDEHGRFNSTAELQEVSGIGPKSFAKLEPLVTV